MEPSREMQAGRETLARSTRRRVMQAGATAAALGLLSACRPGPARSPEEQQPATRRPVTLIVDNDWSSGDRLKVVQAWLERASRVYPHIKTELHDNAADQDKTVATFAADQQGDLFQLDQHMVPVFGPKGVLQDISSTLATLKFDVNTLYDVPNITHWEGKRHGLLIQLNTHTGVYHKNAFQEAGLKEPAPGWTWDDYLEAATRLNRRQEDRWGAQVNANYPYTWFWSADVPYMDEKGTKSYWDRPESIEILQWLADLVLRYQVAPSPREASEKRLNFNAGNYVMVELTVPSPALNTAIAGKFAWEVLPRPKHPKTGKAIYLTTGHNYLVTTKARQRGVLLEAVQVLLELYHPEIQELYLTLNVSSLPILKSVATSPRALQNLPPSMKYALDSITTGSKNYDKVVGFLDFHRAFGPEFAKALNNEVSVKEAAANMTRASDEALKKAVR